MPLAPPATSNSSAILEGQLHTKGRRRRPAPREIKVLNCPATLPSCQRRTQRRGAQASAPVSQKCRKKDSMATLKITCQFLFSRHEASGGGTSLAGCPAKMDKEGCKSTAPRHLAKTPGGMTWNLELVVVVVVLTASATLARLLTASPMELKASL